MICRKSFTASALALALVACGGGGDSGGPQTSAPAPAPAPTPTPTPPTTGDLNITTPGPNPSPTPMPTPTPTPTPVTSYTAFDDLTGLQSFRTACYGLASNGSNALGREHSSFFTDEELLSFQVESNTWSISRFFSPTQGNQAISEDVTFGSQDIPANASPDFFSFAKANLVGGTDGLIITKSQVQNVTFDYLRTALFTRTDSQAQRGRTWCVFGVPSETEDTFPIERTEYATIVVSGVGFIEDEVANTLSPAFDIKDSIATLSVDVDDEEEVVSTLQLRGREIMSDGSLSTTLTDFESLDYAFSAINTAPNSALSLADPETERAEFRGNFALNDTSLIGANYLGWFFGPQGNEVGYAFSIRIRLNGQGETLHFIGTVQARQ